MRSRFLAVAPLATVAALALGGVASAQPNRPAGAVYTQTNSPAGNAVQVLSRGEDGRLTLAGSVLTGGTGTGAGLGSQGAVALSGDGQTLLAVDAGSNDVASFHVDRRGGLALVDRQPTGGVMPISVTIADEHAYVVNAGGGAPSVIDFKLKGGGRLEPRFGGIEPLPPGAGGPAQVSVSPDRTALVVTEKAANRLDVFPLRRGRPGAPVSTPSNGSTPFGFAFDPRGELVVSEATNSTASSYRIGPDLGLRTISASIPTLQGAACWVAVTPDGRYAYTGNAATGSITGFAIGRNGALTPLTADGRTASTPRPNDLAIAGGYLYAINPGAGVVTAYKLRNDGSLEQITDGGATLPAGFAGIAAE